MCLQHLNVIDTLLEALRRDNLVSAALRATDDGLGMTPLMWSAAMCDFRVCRHFEIIVMMALNA